MGLNTVDLGKVKGCRLTADSIWLFIPKKHAHAQAMLYLFPMQLAFSIPRRDCLGKATRQKATANRWPRSHCCERDCPRVMNRAAIDTDVPVSSGTYVCRHSRVAAFVA